MKVRKLSEVSQQFPGFHPRWKTDENGGLSNPRFGSVERIVVCDDDGKPIGNCGLEFLTIKQRRKNEKN